MKKLPPSRRGFTLIEVMVVVVIMGIITTVVATMFAQGSSALQHGEAHNSLQRAYRLLTARITPYLASAFDANTVMGGATIMNPTGTTSDTYSPATVDPTGTTSLDNTLRFITTEDFLVDAYPDQATSAAEAQALSDLGTFIYQIDVNSASDLVLQKRDPSDSFNLATEGGQPVEKPLFFSRENATIELPLRFFHPAVDVIIMEVTLTGDNDGVKTRQIKPTQTFRTTFNLPAKIDG